MAVETSVIRSGRLLSIPDRSAVPHDMLIRDGEIIEIGSPGMAVPDGTTEIDADGMMLIPGLINAHTHGHGSLGKGLGDRWTLEHLLHAGPWISGNRTLDDKRLTAQLNAAEMVLKGSTATYDLYFEFPAPTLEGMHAVAQGYEDVGVRSTIAPMMADHTLYTAIPALFEALPEPAHKTPLRDTRRTRRRNPGELPRAAIRLAVRPDANEARAGTDHTSALQRRFHGRMPRPRRGVRRRTTHASVGIANTGGNRA